LSELIKHIVMFYRYGGKQLYYFNTADNAGEQNVMPELEKSNIEEEDCESCKI